jgi:sugar phosphate isomerase/epimerase
VERVSAAADLGLDGIEFPALGLDWRVGDIAVALATHRVAASGVYLGRTHLIHPALDARTEAIRAFQSALTCALDIGARGVTFAPHRADTPRMPDLRPMKSPDELEAEMLVAQLKTTLADFAFATGSQLHLLVESEAQTHLINRLDRAATVLRLNGDHPDVFMAASSSALAEDDHVGIYADRLAVVYLDADGVTDAATASALAGADYNGWLTFAGDGSDLRGRVAAMRAVLTV